MLLSSLALRRRMSSSARIAGSNAFAKSPSARKPASLSPCARIEVSKTPHASGKYESANLLGENAFALESNQSRPSHDETSGSIKLQNRFRNLFISKHKLACVTQQFASAVKNRGFSGRSLCCAFVCTFLPTAVFVRGVFLLLLL